MSRPDAGDVAERAPGPAQQSGPLAGVQVLSLAPNLPGPWAARRLADLGAQVRKLESPAGDPTAAGAPSWYAELHRGITVQVLDLKDPQAQPALERLLAQADVLLTSTRPSTLARLNLGPERLERDHPRLCHVEIVGDTGAPERPGHDLTYQAEAGTLPAVGLPRVLLADQAGAEHAVSAALTALLRRERTGLGGRTRVGLADAARAFAAAAIHHVTTDGAALGGALPGYARYPAAQGEVAVALLEEHWAARFCELLGVRLTAAELTEVFATRTAREWQEWAQQHELPVVAVRAP